MGFIVVRGVNCKQILHILGVIPLKNSQFECGFPPFDDSRMYFNVRYYLVAILFILFDMRQIYS
jgi:NADH:ubiquinone oxidoreductase subunit 3 (subunit A)